MGAENLGAILRRLLHAVEQKAADQSDLYLLDCFVTKKDEGAFAALMERHGRLVFGVCRSVLDQEQDAEDAFQVTFLVLARVASSIRKRDSLASWLHGVALRTAFKARRAKDTRRRKEPRVDTRRPEQPASEAAFRELQAIIHEEVARLPEKYRAPFVLCCLEGKSRTETAQELGWKEGTVASRVAQARKLLESRLPRRGVALPAALTAATFAPVAASAAVPIALSSVVARGAVTFAAGKVPDSVSPGTVTLAEGVIQTMVVTKMRAIAAVVLVLALALSGGGLLAYSAWQSQDRDPPVNTPEATEIVAPLAKKPDEKADKPGPADARTTWPDEIPLPAGAVRLGSSALRFRQGVYGVTFLGDGKRFATINHNHIRIFDTATAKQVLGWKADDQVNMALAATTDGKRIASAGNNKMIRIWEADTGKMVREFNKHRGERVFTLAFSPDGKHLVSLGSEREPTNGRSDLVYRPTDQGLRVWDADTGLELPAFKDGLPAGLAPQFSADARHLIWRDERQVSRHPIFHMRPLAGGPDRVWDLKDMNDKAKWDSPFIYTDIGYEPMQSGAFLVDWQLVIWDGNKERELRRFPIRNKQGYSQNTLQRICFSPDHSIVATSDETNTITLQYPKTGKSRVLAEFAPLTGMYGLDFTRDGKTLIACAGYEIRLFDVATGKEYGGLGHRAAVAGVALSPDELTVATASHDGTVRLWNPVTGAERHVLTAIEGLGSAVVFLGNKSLVTAGRSLRIWDAESGKEIQRVSGPKEGLYCLALSPDGNQLAAGGGDGLIRFWDTTTWKELRSIVAHKGYVSTLTFSRDGKSLFSGSGADNAFRMWNVDDGSEVRRFNDNQVLQIYSVAVSANGKMALSNTSSRDKGIMTVWDTSTGKEHAKLPPLDGFAKAVAFSPDGKSLVVSRNPPIEDNLLLVDTTTWQIKGKLRGHSQAVNSLVFSKTGRFLISGSDDGSAVVWDLNQVKDDK